MPAGSSVPVATPLRITDASGSPLRVDNATSFAHVGPSAAAAQASELYTATRPSGTTDAVPIQLGEALLLKNAQTGQLCRLAPLPAGYLLHAPVTSVTALSQAPPPNKSSGVIKIIGRGLLQQAASCAATQGLLCDQASSAGASNLTYTGSGLAFNGVPLVVSPGSKTLLLSADPACTVPGGDQLAIEPVSESRAWCSARLSVHLRGCHSSWRPKPKRRSAWPREGGHERLPWLTPAAPARAAGAVPSSPPAAAVPVVPGAQMTLQGSSGAPLRADNSSSYAYFATDDGLTQPAEVPTSCPRPACPRGLLVACTHPTPQLLPVHAARQTDPARCRCLRSSAPTAAPAPSSQGS